MKIGEGSMAFMFESTYMFKFPKFAIERNKLDTEYIDVRNFYFLIFFIFIFIFFFNLFNKNNSAGEE
jgi:hypothetical protein